MITAHILIKNEENFIWYSVTSIIDFIDKIMIWDTGSSDKTKEIVQELIKKYGSKIEFKEVGEVTEEEYSNVRQEMLDETKTPWVFILDGDEIWYRASIEKVVNAIKEKGNNIESVVVETINLIGDIYHYQEEAAGQYVFGNRKGHLALRFLNKNISGLHVSDVYGKEGFTDASNTPIQNRDESKIIFIGVPYLHATHVERSSQDIKVMQRRGKRKYEIGEEFSRDFYYPEAFFMERPQIVPNIWRRMDVNYKLRAMVETPLKKLKRRLK